MEICQNRRGIYIDMKYLDENRVTLVYEMPLNEIIYDFFDNLKSKTKGYASFDYEFKEYRRSNLVKLDIHINGEPVDALSFIVHKDSAYTRGKKMVEKLKTVIPRKLFTIPIQAVIGGQIIARETISAMRKDVLAKCYGGDVTRKNGKRAVTHYRVLENFDKYSFIECQLETGRTHQIRVHMASIGHPILGDDVYCHAKTGYRLQGQTLHAGVLGFIHPSTGEYMEFKAPLPEYFDKLLKDLRNGGNN